MHQIPSLIRADRVGERRHRRAVQAADEHSINVGSAVATLDVAFGEIVRHDGVAPIIREIVCRRTIPLSTVTVALRAVELLVYGLAACHGCGGVCGLGWDGNRRLRLLGGKSR